MKPLIIALDVDTGKDALAVVRHTRAFCDVYKVGPGLLLREGPRILEKIRKLRKRVFLDLKLHDIPNTMVKGLEAASAAGVFSATVHISAGRAALEAAVALKKRPRLWGVTVLTSLLHDDLGDLGLNATPLEQACRLARLARLTGLEGVVSSVGETAEIRGLLGKNLTIVTPGIRLPENNLADQKRIATPRHARDAGADFIVVGRPILESRDPALAARAILKDWDRGDHPPRRNR